MDRDADSLEALKERVRRLEIAVDATELGLWEWNVSTGRLSWNQRNRDLFGVTHQEPLTITDYPLLVHPDDRERIGQAYREARDKPDGGDFAVEHRTAHQPDGKTRWLFARGRVIKNPDGGVLAVGSTLDITDRMRAEERRRLILAELAHRAKNGILVMMTLVNQTARGAASVPHFEQVLTARLQAMADSQDLVTEAAGLPLPLTDLLTRALALFDGGRFDVDPRLAEIDISGDMVVALALLLHELSTNAVKYGALSSADGRVALELHRADDGQAVIGWAERGGPPVSSPNRRGFGTRLLDISLRNNGGHVDAEFHPDGFRATIHFPIGPG